MKKSLTILMALTLAAVMAACNQSPLGPDNELAVEVESPAPGKQRPDEPILPPDPEIQLPPHIDPGEGAGGGGGDDGGREPRPKVDL